MRLLLIEDSLRLQRSLATGFKRAGFAIDVVSDGQTGLTFAQRGHYDVILLDLTLPGMDGMDVLEQLRATDCEAPILILTARHGLKDRVQGLRGGADDYVPKPFAFEELLARVEVLVRRRYGQKSSALKLGDLSIDTSQKRAKSRGRDLPLTKREYSILEYLARRQGETVPRMDIEDHIYGEQNLPSSNAVDSAICILRSKLGTSGKELIRTRRGQGYVLEAAG